MSSQPPQTRGITTNRNRERGIFGAVLKRYGITRDTYPHIPELIEALCVEGGDEIVRMRLAEAEATPDSEHVKALKEAGIFPADQVMVRYVDLRAKRGKFTPDELFGAALEWAARGYNRGNISRICDWAQYGIDSDSPVATRKAQA